ncbi:thioredoxin reductase (NADPH) [Kribbella voronezhensis]|uniref:Thioredoxin reductase (NADPH) n=1 Tax=Kribbella voronezhensis TaxID=2512212 RepID=A0A4R7TI67_9ACTN|nr:FAD-dependent oxidoreductase [Kribbella voronezhensis]TDU91197.1 thioredoxin reductase (NADPH) [Kribbella voronezhensis]
MKETPDLYGAYPRLEEYQLAELTPLGERRTTSAGDVLQPAGEPSDEFIVVLDGTVAVVQDTAEQERVVAVHGPHRFLGEIGMLTGQQLFLSAVAQEPGEVLAVPLDQLRDLVPRDPRLADLILRAFLIRRSLQLTLGAGFAIVGSRFSADTRRLREFAARNRLPHHWIDLENDAEAERLLRELGLGRDETPVVIWRGQVLRNPDNEQLAAAVGLRRTTPVRSACDLIVVGAGPAGLAAAVYGASEGLATVVLDSVATGGQAGTSSRIENYLGFPAGISGAELADLAEIQARRFGAELTVPATAVALEERDGHHVVQLANEARISSRAVLIASGVRYRKLELPGLDAVTSASVYYAATELEANLCRNDPVVVVGGGNSAGQAAVFLAQHAAQVVLVVRSNELGQDMSRYLADRIEQTDGIAVLAHSELRAAHGDRVLEEVVVEDLKTGQRHVEAANALFVFIGSLPHVRWLGDQIVLDDRGFVLTGSQLPGKRQLLETSRTGVFAAGDVRSGSVRRVAAAVGDGALAVRMVHEHLGHSR